MKQRLLYEKSLCCERRILIQKRGGIQSGTNLLQGVPHVGELLADVVEAETIAGNVFGYNHDRLPEQQWWHHERTHGTLIMVQLSPSLNNLTRLQLWSVWKRLSMLRSVMPRWKIPFK